MKIHKMQGQSDYFSGIWIVKDTALWYAVSRANRSAKVCGITNTEKEKDMGLIKAAMGACGTVNKGKFCANCGTPRT